MDDAVLAAALGSTRSRRTVLAAAIPSARVHTVASLLHAHGEEKYRVLVET